MRFFYGFGFFDSVLLFVAIAGSVVLALSQHRKALQGLDRIRGEFFCHEGGRSVSVVLEDAVTSRQQRVGMMFRCSIDPDSGMRFSWSRRSRRAIWMKNVVVPLDLIFLDPEGVVILVVSRRPGSWWLSGLGVRSSSLIEMPGGFCAFYDIDVGCRFIAKGPVDGGVG